MSPRPGRITHRFDLPFSRQFLGGASARASQGVGGIHPLREEVLSIIFADEEAVA